MAAFFLYKDSNKINKESVFEHFASLSISQYSEFQLNSFNLILFKKPDFQYSNFIEQEKISIFVAGSMIYKGYNYQMSLSNLLIDYSTSTIDVEQIRGNYAIIFFNKETSKITFLTDPLFSKNIYFDGVNEIVSSNFISIVESKPFYYKINNLALIESVISGSLIAPDTYAIGIEKLCKSNYIKFNQSFGFNKVEVDLSNKLIQLRSFSEAVDHANQQLSDYFNSLSSMDQEWGTHIGLTGGFDSRLLLIHARKLLNKLNTNSFYRPNSLEYKLAKELAESIKIDFVSHEFAQKIPTSNLLKSLRFLDGQIRSQNFIDEPFNLPEYGSYLYKNQWVGFHGCGGEQYRNADRFKRNTTLRDFIKDEWLYRESGRIVTDKNLEKKLLENIEAKIKANLTFQSDKVDLFLLKRIQNEIWNTANRLTRVNALNQQFFYFAPFTEWQQSVYAYSYIPFLGINSRFQIEMMKRVGKEELKVKTTYGFNILESQSMKSKMVSNIAANIPRKLLIDAHRWYRSYKNKKRIVDFEKDETFGSIYESIDVVKALSNSNTSHNLLALNVLRAGVKLKY
jgi:hypothetical protein